MFIPDDYLFIGALIVGLMVIVPILYIMNIRSNAKEVFTIIRALKDKETLATIHYTNGVARTFIPVKEQYDLGEISPFWKVGGIYKYRDLTATKIEFWEGKIPWIHYFVNVMEPVAIRTAAAMDQIKDLLAQNKINIDGIEDMAFYLLAEMDIRTMSIEAAMKELHVEDDSTKRKLEKYIKFIEYNRDQLEKIRLRTAPFSFQTCQRAIDDLQAAGSIYFERAKQIIEAAALRRHDAEQKNWIYLGMGFLFICVGIAVVATAFGWV